MIEAERHLRHQQAILASDIKHLKDCLIEAGQRFEDIATLIEQGNGYNPIDFLRASAERYKAEGYAP